MGTLLQQPGLVAAPPWAAAWGDDEYGVWADLVVGPATQRLRWVAAGDFWMGSPDDEPGRKEDEGPLHRVRISQGFWIADTPCTQAFWQALVGGNPSHFKGDDRRPVETVSWNEVQAALNHLTTRFMGGYKAGLPTEAMWEYAARAGTRTAFNGRAPLSHDRANFGYKLHGTCEVKRFAPNDWGLYDCQGQVWEWCDDGLRPYPKADEADIAWKDPTGGAGPGGDRAVRGGAWFSEARLVCSARRFAYVPSIRHHGLGFRLVLCVSLRSTSPDQGPGGPTGPGTGP